MAIKDEIILLADHLIREKGYNAFSFYDISRAVGIKTSSIHYYFPSKTDLGIAVIHLHFARFEKLIQESASKSPLERLECFFGIYSQIQDENKVCVVGALATDFHTVEEALQRELQILADQILQWLVSILEEGKKKKIFRFKAAVRTKAIMIISNMMSIVKLSRLTQKEDFELVKNTILQEITIKANL